MQRPSAGGGSRPDRPFLKQQSYSFSEHPSLVESRSSPEPVADATSLIRTCEAWACEAFRLPGDFLHTLAEAPAGGKKKRWVQQSQG